MNTVPTAAVKIKAGCMNTMTMKYTNTDLTKSCSCGMRYRAAIPRDPAAKRTMTIFLNAKTIVRMRYASRHEEIGDQVIDCGRYCVKGICGYHA